MLNGNASIEYFPEPKPSRGKMKVELDLSNYATKVDLKNTTCVDPSKYAKNVDLASWKLNVVQLNIDKLKSVPKPLSNLKIKVDKLDIEELETAAFDLSKLSNVVKNGVVKKTEYNAKIKNIEDNTPDITNVATKTTLNAKINEFKGEILSITNLTLTAALNTKRNECKGEIPSIIKWATTTDLTAVENKIPNVSNLVKKIWL